MSIKGYDGSASTTGTGESLDVRMDVANYNSSTGAGEPQVEFNIASTGFDSAHWLWLSGGYLQMLLANDSSLALMPVGTDGFALSSIGVDDPFNPLDQQRGIFFETAYYNGSDFQSRIRVDGNYLSFDQSGTLLANGNSFLTTSQTTLDQLTNLTVKNSSNDDLFVVDGLAETVDVTGKLRVGGYDVLTFMEYVGQDKNLVYNGYGEEGDLSNISGMDAYIERNSDKPLFEDLSEAIIVNNSGTVIDPSRMYFDATAVIGAFKIEQVSNDYFGTKQIIPINPSKRYRMSFFYRMENYDPSGTSANDYVYFSPYDRDGNSITATQTIYMQKSDNSPVMATLTEDFDSHNAVNGYYDLKLSIPSDDVVSWQNSAPNSSRGIVAWNYLDYGFSNDPAKPNYSRHSNYQVLDGATLIHDGGDDYTLRLDHDRAISGGTVIGKFRSDIGDIIQGETIGICQSGGHYYYLNSSPGYSNDQWYYVVTEFFGGGYAIEADKAPAQTAQFRYGTARISPRIRMNTNSNQGIGGTGVTIYLAGIRVEMLEEANSTVENMLDVGGDTIISGTLTVEGETYHNEKVHFYEEAVFNGGVQPFQLTQAAGDISMGAYGN